MRKSMSRVVRVLVDAATQIKGARGVFVPQEAWDEFLKVAPKLQYEMPDVRQRNWSYTLDEAEIGMCALMSYFSENTEQPYNGEASIRFIGRVDRSLVSAIHDYSNWKSKSHMNRIVDDRFKNMKAFAANEDGRGGRCAFDLNNGAEIVRIAKEYYHG